MNSFRSIVDFACVAFPKVAGGLCMLLLNINLMSRLGPESFGIFSLCLAAIGLLSEGLFGSAIDMGVLRLAPLHLESKPEKAMEVERAAWLLKMQIVGGLAVALILGSIPISQFFFHRAGTAHLISISCAAALGTVLLSTALLHLQVRGRFFQYAVLDVVHNSLKFGGIGAVLFALRDHDRPLGSGSVLIWFAIGPLAAYAIFLTTFGKSFFRKIERTHGSRGELLRYVKWFLATALLSSLVARIDIFLLTTLATIEEVGIFAGGQVIAMIPVLVGMYLGIVLNPKVMPYWRDGKMLSLLRNVQGVLLIISVVVYASYIIFRESITTRLLPDTFAHSGEVILILLPAALASMTSFPVAVAFLMFVNARFLIRLDCLLVPCLIVGHLAAIPQFGALGAAVVTATYCLIRTLIAQYAAFRWARLSPEAMGVM